LASPDLNDGLHDLRLVEELGQLPLSLLDLALGVALPLLRRVFKGVFS
jgi:hypothetical protein